MQRKGDKMIPLPSKIDQQIFVLYVLIDLLKPNEYIVECICQLDNKYIDLTIHEDGKYYIIRIPFYAVAYSLSFPGITVRIEQPQLIMSFSHEAAQTKEHVMIPYFPMPMNEVEHVAEDENIGRHIIGKIERLLLPYL